MGRVSDPFSAPVSGKVTDISGNGLSGITISITGTTATVTTTGNDGAYSSTALQNGSYTVTPSLTGYNFIPVSRSATVNGANLTGQDFTATASSPDTTAPQLKSFSFSPTSVDVSNQAQVINFTGHATDDISGVNYFLVQLRGPSGVQYAEGRAGAPTTGNLLDGVYNFSATIPKSAEQGAWFVQRVELYDKIGNGPVLYENQLITMGFPTKIQVIYIPQ